ncbi:hypothetical protein LJC60_01005 [Ruminococcaceae bacterium OttesenSCG-928-D13]|nr:hypothetical protein [Ruminococcaceae bacterium OttesenSCG-928-D13]
MLGNGYIKLHRSLLNWEWYSDINTSRLFLHLLLIANHDPDKWRGITIERGQRVTSRAKLAEETGLTEDEIRTALQHLQTTGEITSKSTNKYTVITIVNYEKYQGIPQQIPSKSPANSPAIPQPFPTKEESKKARKEKDILTDIQKEPEWDAFVSMRRQTKKPLTSRAAAMALNKLEELAPGDISAQKKILDQSTYHCWQGLFALKEQEAPKNGDARNSEVRPALPGVTYL